MNEKAEQAQALFREGYNCSQAVLGAFCDEVGMDLESAMKLGSSFGGGMGRLREVCGALSAVFIIAGIKYGYSSPKDALAKAEHYALIQQLAHEFREKHGSLICRDLLGPDGQSDSPVPTERTPDFYAKRPCLRFIASAAAIADELLKSR